MNIALIGYGKMGKEIERLAPEHKTKIIAIFTKHNNEAGNGLTRQSLKGVDVCIDVSSPFAVMDNIRAVASCKKQIVVGTTGWYDKLSDVTTLVQKKKIGLLYAANFSIGMNMFYQAVSVMAGLSNTFHGYDAGISETHHTGKLDSPSATALTLAQTIIQQMKNKKTIAYETLKTKISPEQLQIASMRLGKVVGTHRVLFDSDADTIELVHTAKNRSGFAHGALIAAAWLKGKKGIFTMKNVMDSIL